MQVLQGGVHTPPSHEPEWSGSETHSTQAKQSGHLRRVGINIKSGNDISLMWLRDVGASFYGPPTKVSNPFDAKTRLGSWSERYNVDLVEVITFFNMEPVR